ncbi:hypothetical protein LP420_07090 [Massilia sp. B-10]|nr:hypothetical protein LP420_07090 [Massilia sp. B-10]
MKNESPFDRALARAVVHAQAHLGSLDEAPVAARASLETLRARLAKPLNGAPMAADSVIDELVADTAGGLTGQRQRTLFRLGDRRLIAHCAGGRLADRRLGPERRRLCLRALPNR